MLERPPSLRSVAAASLSVLLRARCRAHRPSLCSVQAAVAAPPTQTSCLAGTGTALGMPCTWRLRTVGLSWTERVEVALPSGCGGLVLRAAFDAASNVLWQSDANGDVTTLLPGDDAFDRALLCTWARAGLFSAAAQAKRLESFQVSPTHLSVCLPGSAVRASLRLCASTGHPEALRLRCGSAGYDAWTWAPWPGAAEHVSPGGQRTVFRAAETSASEAEEDSLPPFSDELLPPSPLAEDEFSSPVSVPCARGGGGQFLISSSAGPLVVDTRCDGSVLSPSAAASAGLRAFGEQSSVGLGGPIVSSLCRGALSVGHLRLPPSWVHSTLSLDGVVASSPLPAAAGAPSKVGSARPSRQPQQGALPVAGVLGAAFLRRCVLELRAPRRPPGGRDAPAITATLHPRSAFSPPDRVAACWQEVCMVDGSPHVRARVALSPPHPRAEASAADAPLPPPPPPPPPSPELLLCLALGVGGAGVVLSCSAAASLGLSRAPSPPSDDDAPAFVLQPGGNVAAPGASRARMAPLEEGAVLSTRAHAVELRGATFSGVRVIAHTPPDPPDLELSCRTDGLLCADALRGCSLFLDLAGRRVAFVQHTESYRG